VFIPVIEVDGERVSVYRVEEDALRARLASGTPGPASQTGSADGGL
jgi:hypothetical protein